MNTAILQQFFADCVGSWKTERTYHYLTYQEVERSRTEFTVNPLTPDKKAKVLADNIYPALDELDRFWSRTKSYIT